MGPESQRSNPEAEFKTLVLSVVATETMEQVSTGINSSMTHRTEQWLNHPALGLYLPVCFRYIMLAL